MSYQPILDHTLNFARKYRPQTLDAIIGQDVPLRMLKNSLYKNIFFPVYLFSGQRGCGKTTTARVFARALNCLQLEAFRQAPTAVMLPCLTCASCLAMIEGNHPDFIEIDGASHNGVDNIRLLIETAYYLPSIGRKKVYLIDEAHMLSKAAFNAFLKVLEEPPKSALFMLATTEREKIPETVLSRCFQAHFPALSATALTKILTDVCVQEKIEIAERAIGLIIQEAGGAARDALTLLEKLHLHHTPIQEETVIEVIGGISPVLLTQLIAALLERKHEKILQLLENCLTGSHSVTRLWNDLLESLRTVLWSKIGIARTQHTIDLATLSLNQYSKDCIYNCLELMFHYEAQFMQTDKKELLLELVLLLMCEQPESNGSAQRKVESFGPQRTAFEAVHQEAVTQPKHSMTTEAEARDKEKSKKESMPARELNHEIDNRWSTFVTALSSIDMLLHAIFSSALFIKHDQENNRCIVRLRTATAFITEAIEEKKNLWQPLLQKEFSNCNGFLFDQEKQSSEHVSSSQINKNFATITPLKNSSPALYQQQNKSSEPERRQELDDKKKSPSLKQPPSRALALDQFPATQWPKLHLILSHFPGTLKKNIDK